MKNPLFLMQHRWVRAVALTGGSTAAFLIVYALLKLIFSEDGELSEYWAVAVSLIANLWTGAVFNLIATGALIPSQDPSPKPSPSAGALRGGSYSTAGGRYIGSPIAATLLSIAWLGSWFYVSLLHDGFRGALFDPAAIGVSLSEIDAMKISAELGGRLSYGITFPLFAASAFIVGWACSSYLRLSVMLIPATAFCVIAAVLNYGDYVWSTGRPPLYDVMRVILRAPEGQVTSGELGLMWLITLAVFPIGCVAFAVYGWIWSGLGFSLRTKVIKSETQLDHEDAGGTRGSVEHNRKGEMGNSES